MKLNHRVTLVLLVGLPVGVAFVIAPTARHYRGQRMTWRMIDELKTSNMPPARVRAWIDRGANMNGLTIDGFTPLSIAAMRNDLGAMRTLLDEGADIEARIYTGDTALTVSATSGYFDGAKLLVDRGAKGDIRDTQGRTTVSKVRKLLHDVMAKYSPPSENREERMVRLLKTAGAKE